MNDPLTVAEDAVGIEFFVPCGDDIVTLLSQASLSDSFILKLLRNRGIVNLPVDRSEMIEHFVLSYLSASEFEVIMEELASSEESLKLRTVSYKLSSNQCPLITTVPKPSDFNLSEAARDPNGNYVIEGAPNFVKQSNGDYALDYGLRRRNIGTSWLRSQEKFTGRIVLAQSEDKNKLLIKFLHSSRESKDVNAQFNRWLKRDLKNRNLITSDEGEYIKFGDFTHGQRMAFFMRFTGSYPDENFEFDKVTDFDFKVDRQKIPQSENRIAWMSGTVSRSSLKGSALQDLFILKEKNVWSFLELWRIELKFKMQTADWKGSFSLILEFDGYGSSGKSDCRFQFSLSPISAGKFSDSTEKERRKTQVKIDSFVQQFADEAMSSKSSVATSVSQPIV